MTQVLDATGGVPVSAPTVPAEPIGLGKTVGSFPPPPETLVEGIRCEKGHFNHPRQPFCMRCGQALVYSRYQRAREARPAVGTLTRDDGALFVLDRDFVVVDEHSLIVQPPTAGIIVLASPRLRRVDVEIRLCGWDVVVAERGSELPVSLEPPVPDRMIPLCIPAVGLRRRLRPFQRFCARMTRANPDWARWTSLPPVKLSPNESAALPASWTLRVGERSLLFESPFVGLRIG